MKHLIAGGLFAFSMFGATCAMQAQCAIDFDFGESTFGVSPDPNLGETFVTGMLDQPYSDVLHILIPTSAADIDDQFPPTLPIDSTIPFKCQVR